MLEDTKLGLKRNLGSTIASISLLLIALLLIGSLLLTRIFIDDALNYVESQLAMKVYVEDGLAEDVAEILKKQSYASHVEIESGSEMIEQLAFFFQGKEHLLEAFTDGSVQDAVKFQVEDKAYMQVIAESLQQIDGIDKVVYPQQMAQTLANWIHNIELYGTISVVVFLLLAFCMVYFTTNLAMFKREKELKVKLLLGMNPKLVRIQFMLEGAVQGLTATVVAGVITSIIYSKLFLAIQAAIPYIGKLTTADLWIVLCIQFGLSIVLSILASFISTRKMIAYV